MDHFIQKSKGVPLPSVRAPLHPWSTIHKTSQSQKELEVSWTDELSETIAYMQWTTMTVLPDRCCHFSKAINKAIIDDLVGRTSFFGQPLYWKCRTNTGLLESA